MFSLESLQVLIAHMEWADAEVWRVVEELPRSDFDSRLRDSLVHLHFVQQAFLNAWTGRPVEQPRPADFVTPADLRRWLAPYYSPALQFLTGLDPARLSEPMVVPWVGYFEGRLGRRLESPSLAETIFQVTSHSTYHRGQVNSRLRELGAVPPLVDFIAWVWFGKPSARWPDQP